MSLYFLTKKPSRPCVDWVVYKHEATSFLCLDDATRQDDVAYFDTKKKITFAYKASRARGFGPFKLIIGTDASQYGGGCSSGTFDPLELFSRLSSSPIRAAASVVVAKASKSLIENSRVERAVHHTCSMHRK